MPVDKMRSQMGLPCKIWQFDSEYDWDLVGDVDSFKMLNQTFQGLYPQTVGAMWICASRWNDSIASQILHKVMSIKILDGIDGVQVGKIILIRRLTYIHHLEEAETGGWWDHYHWWKKRLQMTR